MNIEKKKKHITANSCKLQWNKLNGMMIMQGKKKN